MGGLGGPVAPYHRAALAAQASTPGGGALLVSPGASMDATGFDGPLRAWLLWHALLGLHHRATSSSTSTTCGVLHDKAPGLCVLQVAYFGQGIRRGGGGGGGGGVYSTRAGARPTRREVPTTGVAMNSQPHTGQSASCGDVKSSYGGAGGWDRRGCATWAPRSATRQGEEQHRHTECGSHTKRDKGEHNRQGVGAQQGRRGNQNSGNREPEWSGWWSVRMGGSDNKGDGLASQPRRYRVPGQPLLNRHQVGGVSRSPDGLFVQQEREPIRGRRAVRGKRTYGGRPGQRVEEPRFPQKPQFGPTAILVHSVQGRALPSVRWMFDFYCALSRGQRDLGNQPNRAPGPHRNTSRQAMDGLWTEVCGQQKQSNDPCNNQDILNTPIIGRR